MRFPGRRQWAGGGVVPLAGDEQLFRGEARDDLGAVLGHHQLLFDARRRPSVRRRPEGLQRKDHVFLDHLGMFD